MYVMFPRHVLDIIGPVRFSIVFMLPPVLASMLAWAISMRIIFVVNNHVVVIHLRCPCRPCINRAVAAIEFHPSHKDFTL